MAERIEALLPVGVRPRQLRVRTLLVGILLALADGRPAHLAGCTTPCVALGADERRRLGVVVDWKAGPHVLTYRQVERTFSVVVGASGQGQEDGTVAAVLQAVIDALWRRACPTVRRTPPGSYAVDWTDVESFSSRRRGRTAPTADPEASWGHRKGGGPGEKDELFFGYYLQLATMVNDESGTAVPELVRRMAAHLVLTSTRRPPSCPCSRPWPPRAWPSATCSSTRATRTGSPSTGPCRCGASGPSWSWTCTRTTGAPRAPSPGRSAATATSTARPPRPASSISNRSPGGPAQKRSLPTTAAAELARYKLGRVSAPDADGYHRVRCPAAIGKVRCPLRPASMALGLDRPEIVAPPDPAPPCCTQQTITVPPEVNAKTAQKHDYPGQAHRRSYARRSAVERSNSTIKDPASTDIARGWCRVMGLTPMTVLLACALVVRNLRVLDSFERRQADDERRRAAGLGPKTRRRRRRTIDDLVGAAATAPP